MESDIDYSIVRCGMLQHILNKFSAEIVNGNMSLPMKDKKFAPLSATDVNKFVAKCFLKPKE